MKYDDLNMAMLFTQGCDSNNINEDLAKQTALDTAKYLRDVETVCNFHQSQYTKKKKNGPPNKNNNQWNDQN